MLTSLEIQNFKAFRHLKIERLAKVNLFVGEGNTGKTSMLEVLESIVTDKPFSSFRNGGEYNGTYEWQSRSSRWNQTDLHESDKFSLIANDDQRGEINNADRRPRTIFTQHKIFSCAVVPTRPRSPEELARIFDKWTLRDGDEERFIKFAQSVDPRVKALRPKEHTGTRMLYASIGLPEVIPLPLLGEGLNRLIEIYGAIIGEGANIVLIDEIENGLHWKALPKVWQGIKAVVDAEDVQIFATTHSIECIEAASEVFKGPPNDFAVHRLERRDDGDIHCVTMGEVELGRMLERGWEVR